jgi:alkanesulfonate monooxygenase SsuD/methylene tetrahydromethanopterin reductase-like flavin-dependent oxidoreductase (luciferase family)
MLIDLLLVPFGATYAEMRAAALAAEEAGFNGLWTFDHLREPRPGNGLPVPECLTTLSAIAEATSRIQLGPLVLNVANRRPGVLANMAATLQQISSGRLVLALGAGGGDNTPYFAEQAMLGETANAGNVRAEQVAETAQVLHLLWSEQPASFSGRHFRLDRAAGYLRPSPPPPIIIGGFGPRMARIAGRFGDGFNAPAGVPGLSRLVEIARTERERAGRSREGFEISVFSGFNQRWLNPGSADRGELDGLGVDRLILQVEPPYPLDRIRGAAPQLRPPGL